MTGSPSTDAVAVNANLPLAAISHEDSLAVNISTMPDQETPRKTAPRASYSTEATAVCCDSSSGSIDSSADESEHTARIQSTLVDKEVDTILSSCLEDVDLNRAKPRRPSILKVSPQHDQDANSESLTVQQSQRWSSWKRLPPPDWRYIQAARQQQQPRVVAPKSGRRRVRFHKVTFEDVHIRHYHQTIGDNPSVSYGTPISLDWTFEQENPIRLDDYEEHRSILPRRSGHRLILSSYQRKNVLSWVYGHSPEALQQAKIQANQDKRQRWWTQTMLSMGRLQEGCHGVHRAVRYVFKKSPPPP